MAEFTTVARPYAKAAFEHAMAANALQNWSEMVGFAAAVVADEQMQALLSSPHLTHEQQRDAMLQVCEGKLDAQGQNFIKLLSENHRLLALPQISEIFEHLKAEFEKTIDANVMSASELNAEQQENLKQKLATKLGRQVNINVSVDPTLLGGLVIEAEDMVIDGSVRGKLTKLSETLKV
ncbi:F0F1 ATP synthase subunit delta [Pleionea sp. CnH1-48]|uniref:F0F1 ATP synthase subunit delta n=1 Tax=Pleionea sp. CnH1-48 TaxID=2954494 RepID=UPI002097A166|nr:F0F1 ATP synthase subunit delta [Pleionea sp. CnH1-48]MCO7226604.1 F0F1 ATP synthase subunit delta [Pleionea sp. CnH1-48]